METSSIKLTQLTSGAILLLAGILFFIITLLGSLVPSFYEKIGIWIMIAIPLFLIFIIEGAIYWISKSLAIDEEKMKNFGRKDIVSQFASTYALLFRYGNLIGNIIFILVILAFSIFISYMIVIKPMITEGVVFSINFYIQLGVYVLWFLLIRRFFMNFLYKVGVAARKNLPSYSLENDGVLINLKFRKGSLATISVILAFTSVICTIFISEYRLYFAGGFILFFILAVSGIGSKIVFYPIKIRFDEIDEIRELDFVEAQSLLKYQIGPNLTLEAQGAIDMANFLRKKIERPNVYVLMPYASTAKTLVIKGKNVFYLTAVENENLNDLTNAFNRYKMTIR